MNEPERVGLTLGLFVLTLALVLARPHGRHEAWWTSLGGGLMLLLRLETPAQAWAATRAAKDILLFLLALLLLSALLDRSGFFEWAAIRAARLAAGDGHRLYRNVFLLGALITATLSLDTTAVILTPLVLAFVDRLRLPSRPYVFACAFVANAASLPLPVSNLTNLLFAGALHLQFGAFAARMILPQAGALAVNYGLFRLLFRRELPQCFDSRALPEPSTVVPHPAFFRGAVWVLALVLIGYFLAPFIHLEPYTIGFLGCGALALWGVRTGQVRGEIVRHIEWPLFPFVIGLFLVVRGVENLHLAAPAAVWLMRATPDTLGSILLAAAGGGIASNVVNNVPAALLALTVLREAHAGPPPVYGALLGTNIGPNVTLFGSLATMLVLTSARKRGEDVRGGEFLRVGLIVTPPTLLAASLILWLSFRVF